MATKQGKNRKSKVKEDRMQSIASGDKDRVATQAAKRVIEKRALRKAGVPLDGVPLSTEQLVEQIISKAEAVIDNPEPEPVKKHGKEKKPELITKYINAEGKSVLGTVEPLPNPHTEGLKLGDIVDEMNMRFNSYVWMTYTFKDDIERDARVRQDFARYGAMDESIRLVKVEGGKLEYQRVETKKGKR